MGSVCRRSVGMGLSVGGQSSGYGDCLCNGVCL